MHFARVCHPGPVYSYYTTMIINESEYKKSNLYPVKICKLVKNEVRLHFGRLAKVYVFCLFFSGERVKVFRLATGDDLLFCM